MKKFLSILFVLILGVLTASCWCLPSEAADSDKVLTVRKASALVATDWNKLFTTSDCQIIWTNVFEGLYGINEAHGGYYNELAKEVKISDDQLTYTITLNDATFQNGDSLNASDVVFSYEMAMENPRWGYLTGMIDKISKADDKTVVFTLKHPYSPIAHTFFSIKISSEKEVTSAGADFGTKPHKAGTGPYYISEYNPATGVKFKAYDGYWRGAPKIKNIDVVLITEDSAAVIAYENGELGYMHDAPTAEWEELASASDGRSAMVKGNSIRMLNVNYMSKTNNSILANPLVRKAICYAVDKETVNKVATNGYGVVAYEYMPSDYVQTSPPASAGGFELYKYNPEKARELLKEAGYTDEQLKAGVSVGTLTTYGAATGEKAKQAQVIQANLADVGLKCEVEVADVAIISPRLHSYDYDLAVFGDSGNFDYNNIRQMVHSESVGMDVIHFKTDNSPFNWKRLEELCDLGVSTSDVAKRLGYYTELWNIVQETATIFPLIHMPVGVVWGKDVDPGDICPTYFHFYDFSWK
ncbi:MAG: ABC transporter substrate-binding protein [Synergistaceae bacterium]|nr:ABC transporter substrate-binding protein [Synergistaceae bacterium]